MQKHIMTSKLKGEKFKKNKHKNIVVLKESKKKDIKIYIKHYVNFNICLLY